MMNLKSQSLIIIFMVITISIILPSYCKNLIEATCKKTPNYTLCVQSLKSDPASSKADVAGLGLIMVKVIEAKAKATSDKINQLLGGGHLEPKQEKALRSCAEMYMIMLEAAIPDAKGTLRGDPKFAEEDLTNVGNDANYCEEEFSGRTSPLTTENNALHDLAVVAVAIVRLLL